MAATTILGEADFPPEWEDMVPDYAFDGRVDVVEAVIPDRFTKIGKEAFRNCTGLVNVRLPGSLTEIGNSAFFDCRAVRELALPASLTKLGVGAFRNCSGIESITFAKTGLLQSIPAGAFYGCTSLVELELPASVHTIDDGGGDDGAFQDCPNLRILILPPALTSLGAAAFKGSVANLRMLVVPPTAPAEVAATMAATLGPRKGKAAGATCRADVDLPAVPTVQLVSAPDAVVASLGGVFADMTTMAQVRAAGRAITTALDYHHWTVKTHKHQVCSPGQRQCAHTVLLVGARLYSLWATSSSEQLLPALPDELWLLVLGWLRRPELGVQ